MASIPQQTILTDVGSVKEPIVNTWENSHPLFIGSHPMAGTENKGVDSGFEGLFKNAKWIITPTQNSDLNSVRTISELIKSMNCEKRLQRRRIILYFLKVLVFSGNIF